MLGVLVRTVNGPLELRTAALHVSVLSAFAIAQPLFAIYGKSPAFFVAWHPSRRLVAFTIFLLAAPPSLAGLRWLG